MRCLFCDYREIQDDALETEKCPECGRLLNSYPVLKRGHFLKDGKYEIIHALSKGGFGIVYKAKDLKNNENTVAIKEMYLDNCFYRSYGESYLSINNSEKFSQKIQKLFERFHRESSILMRVSGHKNIVHWRDFFDENNTSYIVMDYVEGVNLLEYAGNFPGQKLPYEKAFAIARQIVDTLDYIHKENVYHCDISPDNIIIDDLENIKFIDFGGAKLGFRNNTDDSVKEHYSPLELFNPAYVSNSLTPASDIFSAGMVIYELLSGEKAPPAVQRVRMNDGQLIEFDAVCLKEPFRSFINRALKMKVELRPRTAKEWWDPIFTNISIVSTNGKCCIEMEL